MLQEENSSNGTCMLTSVKEEVIKPEITIEDDDLLVVHNDSIGLDHFLNLPASGWIYNIISNKMHNILKHDFTFYI